MSGLHSPAPLALRVGEALVTVSTNDPKLGRWLAETMADLVDTGATSIGAQATETTNTHHVVEIHVGDTETTWSVDGARRYASANVSNVVDQLVSWCNRVAADTATAGVNLHAAGLVPPGAAGCVLVPGIPGAGKSSLALAASVLGWGYLSDEMCNVSIADNAATVAAYPKPITVKRGGMGLVELDWDAHTIAPSQTRWYVRPATVGGTVSAARTPLAVVFSTFSEGASLTATTLGASEALVELATHSLDVLDPDGQALLTLAQLCSSTHCVSLTRGVTTDALAHAAALAAEPTPQHHPPTLLPQPAMPARISGPRIHPDTVTVALHDGLVVYQPKTHVVVALAGTAATVWQLLDGSATPVHLAEELADAFAHPVDQVSTDVDALLTQLTKQGLLTNGLDDKIS